MPSGPIVAVTDQGHHRIETSVDRRGVEPVVTLAVFDIAREEFEARGARGLAASRAAARLAELELDEHEWAHFVNYVAIVNLRVHRERQAIAIDEGWVQNSTERTVRPQPSYVAPPQIPRPLMELVGDVIDYLDGEAVPEERGGAIIPIVKQDILKEPSHKILEEPPHQRAIRNLQMPDAGRRSS